VAGNKLKARRLRLPDNSVTEAALATLNGSAAERSAGGRTDAHPEDINPRLA
jgi:hypothetical protein